MLIEFLVHWKAYPAGRVVEWDHPGSAELLFARGVARPAAGAAPAAEPKPKATKKGK